jgi:hypothetical protein
VGGSTDHCAWFALEEVDALVRTDLVDAATSTLRRGERPTT